jgi:PAS domain S-box-containing protein
MKNPDDARIFAESIIDTVREALIVLDESLRVISANKSFYNQFKVQKKETENHLIYELGNGQWNIPDLRVALEEVIPEKHSFDDYEVTHNFETIGTRTMLLNGRIISQPGAMKNLILLAIEDITERKNAQKVIAGQQERYHKFVEEINSIVIVFDCNGNITFANRFTEKLFGYKRDEILGKPFVGIIIPCTDSTGHDNSHISEEIFKDPSRYYAVETEGRRKDGDTVWFSWSARAVREMNGEITEIIIDGNDITSLRLQRQKLYNAQLMMDNSPDMIVSLSVDFRYLFANRPFEVLLQRPASEIIGRRLGDFGGMTSEINLLSQKLNKAIESGAQQVIEIRYGEAFYQARIQPLKDSSGATGSLIIYARDITGLKRTEQALRESEERFRTLADNISQLAWMADSKGEVFWYNKRWYDYTGTTLEEMLDWGWTKVHHPDHVDRVVKKIKHSWDTGEFCEDTFPLRGKDGRYRWFLSRAVPVRNDTGEIVRWLGTSTDITDLRRAESELRIAAERFQRIVSSSIIGAIITDLEGKIFFANDYFLKLTGYRREDLEKNKITWRYITPAEYEQLDNRAIDELQRKGTATPYEKEYFRKDGSRVWVLLAITMLPGPEQQVFVFVLDTTERRHTLEEAQRRQAEVEAILNSIPDGYVIYEQDGKISKINDMGQKVLGFSEDILKLSFSRRLQIIHPFTPDNKTFPLEKLPSYRALHGETVRGEMMKTSTPGGDFWLSVSASPISIDGKLLGAIVEFSDITSIHNLQEQLASDRNFIDAVLQTSAALIAVLDSDAKIVRFNKECEKLTGYSSTEVSGKSMFEFLILDNEYEGVKDVFNRLKSCERSVEYENHWRTKSGEKRYIRFRNSVICNQNGNAEFIIATGIDITDRKMLEEQLLNRARDLDLANKELESFSYSVAHDLRNPLLVADGFVDLILEDCAAKLDEECLDYIRKIKAGTSRMRSIITDILALTRISSQEIKLSDVDLSEMAQLTVNELSAAHRDRKVEVIIEQGLRDHADARLMSVALGNLLSNAWKYTSKVENPKIEFGAFEKDGKRVYYVRDNGAGFDMTQSEKLFKPFQRLHSEREFSGTGVGLAIVERAINRHGGDVWAEGEVGKGAAFYFTLG